MAYGPVLGDPSVALRFCFSWRLSWTASFALGPTRSCSGAPHGWFSVELEIVFLRWCWGHLSSLLFYLCER
jgi:hypothetical protein